MLHFKECTPEKTINRIKNILKKNSLVLEVEKNNESEINTYSCRIIAKDTDIGSNGKGTNEIYSLASGYAEFMERYQNGICEFSSKGVKKNFFCVPDEKVIKIKDLLSSNNPCLNKILLDSNMVNDTTTNKIKYINALNYYEHKYYHCKESALCVPFYGLTEKKLVYMPFNLYSYSVGSNGMCAGNTREEALVQGFSEIFERVSQTRVLLEAPELPEIPKSFIDKFPLIKDKVKLLENNKENYKFKFLDCSFNGLYPVVALIVYKPNSGKYGIRFGSHPDLGVAIERTLTEATQGQKLSSFIKANTFTFLEKAKNVNEFVDAFTHGIGCFPHRVFASKKTSYALEPFLNMKNKSNKELFEICLNIFKKLNKNVYIRDCSIFSFPSYHIYVPNLSEIHYCDSFALRLYNSHFEASKIISYSLKKCSKKDIQLCLAVFTYNEQNSVFSSLQSYYLSYIDSKDIPFEEYNLGIIYFKALGELFIGDYEKSHNFFCILYNNLLKELDYYDKNLIYVRCFMLAMEGLVKKMSIKEVEKYLKDQFVDEIVSKVFTIIKNKLKTFMDFPDLNDPSLLKKEFYKKAKESHYKFYKAYINALVTSKIDQLALKDIYGNIETGGK